MRPTLFLSTLFAMSLFGGAALAEGPAKARPTREPRVIEVLRNRGEVVDKSYKGSERVRVETRSHVVRNDRVSPVRERMNQRAMCTDGAMDCYISKAARPMNSAPSGAASAQRSSAAKSPVDRVKQERANCSSGDECSAPNKMAAARSGTDKTSPMMGKVNMASSRLSAQPYAARVSCNEGEECSISSKESKKIWAYEAVKAGTFKGPSQADARDQAIREARSSKK